MITLIFSPVINPKNMYEHKDSSMFVLWGSYHNEMVDIANQVRESRSVNARRSFVRAFFSMLEGIEFRLRQILLERIQAKVIEVTPKDYIALSEVEVHLNQDGKVSSKETFRNFESLFNFTLRTYAKLYKKEDIFRSYRSKNEHGLFKQAIAIRHRITHPKKGSDVSVTDEEYELMQKVWSWYHEFACTLLEGDLLEEMHKEVESDN